MADARARKRAGHGGGGATEEIPDELLLEAFARLPGLQNLLRCGATCTQWRRLVTDRAFLRRLGHWSDTARRPSFLAGIFSPTNRYPGGSGWRPSSKKQPYNYTPPRFLDLQAGGGKRLTFDSFFAFDDDDALFDLSTPLAARRGFLLARVLLHGDQYNLHLAVCHPVFGTRLLPPPPFRDNNIIGYAILIGEDSNLDHSHQQQPPFQVLFIYYNYNYNNSHSSVCACTYSSDADSWNEPTECCRPSEFTMCGPRAGVVTHGGVHWLFMNKTNLVYYTLNINVATSHVSLTEIPIKVHTQPPIPCIAGEEGRLSFVTIGRHGVAKLWTKQEQYEDDDKEHGRECNGIWRCSELADMVSERIDLVFFVESRGALLVGQQGVGFSIVDLKTKEKTPMHLKKDGKGYKRATRRFPKCCTSTYSSGHIGITCEHRPPVLYEIDWVFSHHMSSLASSQLGGEMR